MTDEVLRELWDTKDNIAKEHGYDIDRLAEYYRSKQKSRVEAATQGTSRERVEQGDPADLENAARFRAD